MSLLRWWRIRGWRKRPHTHPRIMRMNCHWVRVDDYCVNPKWLTREDIEEIISA